MGVFLLFGVLVFKVQKSCNNSQKLEQVFPDTGFVRRQAIRGFANLPAIVAPITLVGENTGVLYMADALMRPEDVPIIAAFANQISLALQEAHLFQALRHTEDQYRRLFETANDAILVVDAASLHIFSANPKATMMTGYSEAALLGMTIDTLIPPANAPSVLAFAAATQEQKTIVAESTLVRANGQTLLVQVSATSFELNGRLLLHGFIKDITEQKRSEALQTAVYQIATITNSDISLEALYASIHRVVGQFLDARNFYIALYDESADLLMLPYFVDERDTYDGRPYKAGRGLTESVIHSGQPLLIDEEGHRQLIQQNRVDEVGPMAKIWLGAPLTTKAETFGAIVVQNYQDRHAYAEPEKQFLAYVSGQIGTAIASKRAELALKQLAAELEKQVHMMDVVLSTTPDFFMIYEIDGRIRYASPGALAGMGLSTAEVVGKDWSQLPLPNVPVAQFIADFQEVIGSGSPLHSETSVQIDGQTHYYEYDLYPVRDPNNVVTAVVSTSRDFTERKQAEEALHHTQKIESLGIMAGGVAHDFNNLLVAIMGQTSLALNKMQPADPAYRHIEKAVNAAEKAADLTQQLLAYSGKGQFTFQPLRLDTIIRENQHLLEVIIPHNVRLEAALSDDLPLIEADPGQIQQVVMNLILNAAEAMEGRPGVIHLRAAAQTIRQEDTGYWQQTKQQLKPGDYVLLQISDNGCGMSPETLDRIFDPFFTTKFTGRGLGLAAVLGIMRGHKGGLCVTSQPEQGTTFDLLFPVAQVSAAAAPDGSLTQLAATAVILVIDDDASVREAIHDILDMQAIHVLLADNGRAGIQLYQQHAHAIDLVMLDWFMPDMNGAETLQILQQINPHVRVLMSSGYSESETIEQLKNPGAVGFLQKPYTLPQLLKEINRHLT
ncbi:MAG: PAS domain S-box protein [Chloroflexi bacterium]|nr:PAS domain S-box protein [Chloroflexota bacterium]